VQRYAFFRICKLGGEFWGRVGKTQRGQERWGVGKSRGNLVSTLREGDAKDERATWRFI
jgi:hypothetical protein